MIHTIPKCIRYTCTHEYVSIVNNIATIGFTPFMRHKLRPIVFVEPYIKIGDNVPQYSLLLRIETPHFYKEMNNPEHCTYYPLFYYRRYILPKWWLNQLIQWCYRLLQNQLLILLKKQLCTLIFGKSFIYSSYISLFHSLTDMIFSKAWKKGNVSIRLNLRANILRE